MASNIHLHQYLMGPALMARGAHAENGVPSLQVCHSYHCNHRHMHAHTHRDGQPEKLMPPIPSGRPRNKWLDQL